MLALRWYVTILGIATSCCTVFLSLQRVPRSAIRADSRNLDQTVDNIFEPLPDIHGRNVFYNRIGKCGSRSLLEAVRRTGKRNNFTWISSPDKLHDHPGPSEVFSEISKIANLRERTFYNRHIHYLDFESVGYRSPVYINMIRDPIRRFSSHYNYLKYGDQMAKVKNARSDWKEMNVCVKERSSICNSTKAFTFYMGMFFCGFDPICRVPGPARVLRAKRHIDEAYAVIGLMEEFDNTLKLLEKMSPEYFDGIVVEWAEFAGHMRHKTATKRGDVLTDESIEILKNEILADEYEVFAHAKQKFLSLKARYGIV